MLKQWLDAGKCLIGAHQGDWVQSRPDACEFVQTCLVCATETRRTEHDWQPWALVTADPCTETRHCSRCGDDQTREEHEPGPWRYLSEGDCTQEQRCVRCERPYADTRTHHQWGSWRYSEANRSPVGTCDRCATHITYLGTLLTSDPDAEVADEKREAAARLVSVLAGHAETRRAEAAASHEEASPRHAARSGRTAAMLASITDAAVADMLTRAESARPGPPPAAPVAPADEQALAALAAIRGMYEQQVATGQIAAERRPRYEALLRELEALVSKPRESLADMQAASRRVQELLANFSQSLMDPSRAEPAAELDIDSRASLLLRIVKSLHAYVLSEIGHEQLNDATGGALARLVHELHGCRDALAVPMDDAQLRKFEAASLRPLMLAVRQTSLREHLAVARPIWPSPVVTQQADAVFVSAGDEVTTLLRGACAERDLRALVPQEHTEPASFRWSQLREAAVGVFDFTGWRRGATVEEIAPTAAVAYELGIALALGRPVMVVAGPAGDLPFDLDIEPVSLRREAGDASRFADALDQTLYGLQRGRAGSSVAASLEWLREFGQSHRDRRVRTSMTSIDDDLAQDAERARLVTSTVLGYLGAAAPQVMLPSWPVVYPRADARSCFHVTPFGPPWARTTREIVRAACPSDVTYVRGDQALEPDIIRSIWDEICGATHVVVDLTGLNVNVVIELGIAHTLGRNVMLISQDAAPERYFRALAKQRVHRYAADSVDGLAQLKDAVQRFFEA